METKYTCRLDYQHALNYGFTDLNYQEWNKERFLSADEYVEYLAGTQVEHITLKEPYKTRFYEGIREAVRNAGNQIKIIDTIALYLTKKPDSDAVSL